MSIYKNISYSAKTFYGVKFEPGEIKEVPGYINCLGMIRVNSVPTVVEPEPEEPITEDIPEEPAPVVTRGRKKKSSEPEKVSVAETESIIETSKEET